jgi:hypothetical protein
MQRVAMTGPVQTGTGGVGFIPAMLAAKFANFDYRHAMPLTCLGPCKNSKSVEFYTERQAQDHPVSVE